MKRHGLLILFLFIYQQCFCWGFYAHRKINYYAVFLLPPEMMVFFKSHIQFLSDHAIDPDKRRYALVQEGPRHYIDIDHYGTYPYDSLPRGWNDAVAKFSENSLQQHGIVPWWVQVMQRRLTAAFKEKNGVAILKNAAEIGHYLADAHVPLHASSNHNGQHTGQHGIHGFWESRVPELLAEKEWDFFIGKAAYIKSPGDFIWNRVLESAAAADTVLRHEKELSADFSADQKFAFEDRNGKIIRQYSSRFAKAYDKKLNGMIERRMRQSIYAIASFWYTAWIDAGQPDLKTISSIYFSEEELKEFEQLNESWRKNEIKGRVHE
jgi:hypothetical protein